ncbi:dimethylsulfonioproprionate lyase family protein, partial [Rhizobium sp.]|uniref:dimethylsulfonioproprionate lyase family protein n=1 Tax=Rhizobium sp. TaxID=391 RepID=UPI000E99117E|nr:transcriptional regulator [Rhizobium sp.]
MTRSDVLQGFIDAAAVAFDQFVQDLRARQSVSEIFTLLETPQSEQKNNAKRLPVCSRHIEDIMAAKTGQAALDVLIERFKAVEPLLEWKARSIYDASASDNFLSGHANTMIIGPDGLEDRQDLWFGATLIAPNVRYPDHDHAPEETYIVLSDGEFMHGDSGWFTPGIGGCFYNPPGIRHAMRSRDTPLFAFWLLLVDPTRVCQGKV